MRAGSARQNFPDDELTGFGLRVEAKSSGGRKSFYYYAKVCGQVVFKSLGECPAVSVKDARDRAREWAGRAAAWKQDGCQEDKNPFAKPKKRERTTTPTFSELVEAYVAEHLRAKALHPEKAEYDLRSIVRKHLAALVHRPVDKVTTEHVLAAKNAAEGKYARESIVELVRRLYNWSAGKNGDGKLNFWKVANPAADISLGERDEPRDRFLQPEELHVFNEQLKKEEHRDLRDILTLFLSTGARKGNVLAARWEDVSPELRQWKIPESKSGFSYTVNLSPAAMEVLEGRGFKKEGFIFPSTKSKTGHVSELKRQWHRFRKAAGVRDIRMHDLRRTRGSYLSIGGVSLQKIAEVLGHRSLASTKIYARLNDEALRSALEVGDATMQSMMAKARKRLKRGARKPRLLEVANG